MNRGFYLLKTIYRRIRQTLKLTYWAFYGLYLTNPPIPLNSRKILFVCKGNICRSPFAHHYALNAAKESASLSIASAGIHAKNNTSPNIALEAAKQLSISMESHQPRTITPDDIRNYDMIVTMEPWQRRMIIKLSPAVGHKVFLLSLFLEGTDYFGNAYEQFNILDPYGKEINVFLQSFRRIQTAVDILLTKICHNLN